MGKLLRFLKPYWKAALLAPLLMLLEVAMDMAIPRDVLIRFQSSSGEKSHEDQ